MSDQRHDTPGWAHIRASEARRLGSFGPSLSVNQATLDAIRRVVREELERQAAETRVGYVMAVDAEGLA